METPEHQEWRSRQQISVPAVLKSTLITGTIFFIMSGGSPWSTAGTMNMIMGRDLALGFWTLLIGHFAVALIYAFIIAGVIYRMYTSFAVPTGVLIGLGLYALNTLVFRSAGLTMQSPEFVVFFVHVMFGLFTSLAYKALSVPPPLPDRS